MSKYVLAVAIVFSLAMMAGCKEKSDSTYPTVADATKDRAFERGWLPAVLQPDATNIHESHDIDSNRGNGTFTLNSQLLKRLKIQCTQTQIAEFRCDGFVVTVDSDKGTGSFLTKR